MPDNADSTIPYGVPVGPWAKQINRGVSTVYGWFETGRGPRSILVGGRRIIRETPEEFYARLEAEQSATREALLRSKKTRRAA